MNKLLSEYRISSESRDSHTYLLSFNLKSSLESREVKGVFLGCFRKAVKKRFGWKAAVIVMTLAMALCFSACGKKESAKGSTEKGGKTVSESAASSGKGKNGSANGNESSGDVGKQAQDIAGQYGITMPEGIVSLADPDAIYDAGSMIQMKNSELYIDMEEGSDWIDSEKGLTSGMKYISVSLTLTDYGAGSVKELPDPKHYYIIEAKDKDGDVLDLGSSGFLGPVTDMASSEIKADNDGYYNEKRAYKSGDIESLWLLYKVPEETREIVAACFLTDEFSEPHDAAFRIKVKEKHESHTFEYMDGVELQKMLDTSERPVPEDFAWFTYDMTQGGYYWGVMKRDPEYDAREYLGGWKCYLLRDNRASKKGFEAHLCNVYVENFTPEERDDYEKGWVDVRIDWYLGFDEDGNVYDESSLTDTVVTHEQFYYNRLENDDGVHPFLGFSFEYAVDRAIGTGTYYDEEGRQFFAKLVRKDGIGAWIKEAEPEEFTTLPGTNDVPLPESLKGAVSTKSGKSDDDRNKKDNNRKGDGSGKDVKNGFSGGKNSGNSESGNIGSSKKSKEATLNDFGWYFNDEYPTRGTTELELWDLGGQWKGIINVVSEVNGENQCRIVVCDTTVDYMGYKLDVSMEVKESYSFPVSDPGSIEKLETNTGTVMRMKGDWDDAPGIMDIESLNSDLRYVIDIFKEKDGRQYALGTVYNGSTEIGEVALFRDVD